MATLASIRNAIRLVIASRLTDPEITQAINTASAEEVENYSWAGLKTTRVINSSGVIASGVAGVHPLMPGTGWLSVTQGSHTAVGTETNFRQMHIGWQLRIAGQMWAPFNVIGVDEITQTVTLDAPYQKPDDPKAGYSLFAQYYAVRDLRLILNVTQQIKLRFASHEDFDIRDPFRSNFSSPATDWAPAGYSANGEALLEFWPIDLAVNGYTVQGLLAHRDMINPTDRPLISAPVIQNKALAVCCSALFGLNGDQRWANQRDFFWGKYTQELEVARLQDRKQYGELRQIRDSLPSFPGLDRIADRNDPYWG